MTGLENVIIKPLLTEKTSKETEAFNRYAFVVHVKSNKNHMKAYVQLQDGQKIEFFKGI